MREQFIALLETFGLPIFLQGSLNEGQAYPDNFFYILERPDRGRRAL
jgi:hypothetical protein